MGEKRKPSRWVFLPGLDGTGEFFGPFLRHLPEWVVPTPVRFPGDQELGYDELFDFVSVRLPKTEPYVLVAESFSGPLAIRLTAAEPPGLRATVVSASFVRNPLPRAFRSLVGEWLFRRPMPKAMVTAILTGRTAPNELSDLFYHVARQSEPRVLAHRAREALSVDETESLRRCRLPIMFMNGKRDQLVRGHNARWLKKIRPDVPHLMLDASHCLLQIQPEEAARRIVEFLEEKGVE